MTTIHRRAGGNTRTRVTTSLFGVLALTAGLTAGCSLTSGDSDSSATNDPTTNSKATTAKATGDAPTAYRCDDGAQVRVATHDSFNLSDDLKAAFEKETGCRLTVLESGDAGQLTNKLVLTKASPIADAVFGIDNTFAGRAVSSEVLAPYAASLPAGAAAHAATGAGAEVLTPVDYGDVCVNVDTSWFAAKGVNPPATFDDLVDPKYRGLFVTSGATTSSPGFAFLLATIGNKGQDGWQDYWRQLLANDTKIVAGWEDAYTVDFTAGSETGTRPIVLSYASSPPFTIPEGGTEPTTAALLDTCFRQVEYAAVLAGAENVTGAKAFVDFMVSRQVQEAIPELMYMFPVDEEAELPEDWAAWAKVSERPWTVDAGDIEANRDTWLRDWSDITSG